MQTSFKKYIIQYIRIRNPSLICGNERNLVTFGRKDLKAVRRNETLDNLTLCSVLRCISASGVPSCLFFIPHLPVATQMLLDDSFSL
jgi:hypothetical protein